MKQQTKESVLTILIWIIPLYHCTTLFIYSYPHADCTQMEVFKQYINIITLDWKDCKTKPNNKIK